jgi:PAS domain S-box-containing protein
MNRESHNPREGVRMPSERPAPPSKRSISLEQQAAFLKAVAERTAPSAIVGKDLAGRVVSWSDGARDVYGYEAQEMLGKPGLILHSPEEVTSGRSEALYSQAAASGKWEGRVRRYRKDGSGFTANVTLLLRRDHSGKPCGLVAVSRDLSEAERIDRELSDSRARDAQILDSRAELLLVTDFAGKVWDVNPLTCAVTGRARTVWVGFELQGKFADPAQCEALLRQTLLHDEVHDFELALLNARGEELGVRCDTLALPGKNGKLDRVLIALRPTAALAPSSARNPGRIELPGLASASPRSTGSAVSPTIRPPAERADQTLSSVAPPPPARKSSPVLELSHELRTPLNAIIGFAELLRSGKVGAVAEAHLEYLGDILSSAKHMQRLLNEGLAWNPPGLPEIPATAKTVELATLAAEVRDGLRLLAISKRIDVRFELAAALRLGPDEATKVRQILYNYLSNALKFTPAGGTVWLRSFRLDEQRVRLEVEDTGPGIPVEHQGRLFREFEQLDITGELRELGSGLGLSINKRLVEALGGSVSLESSPEKGCLFAAILPLSSTSTVSVAPESDLGTPESAMRLVAAAAREANTPVIDGKTLCA